MEKIVEKMLDFAAALWYNIRGYYFFFFFNGNFFEKIFTNFKNNVKMLLLLIDKYTPRGIIFFLCEKFHNPKILG